MRPLLVRLFERLPRVPECLLMQVVEDLLVTWLERARFHIRWPDRW